MSDPQPEGPQRLPTVVNVAASQLVALYLAAELKLIRALAGLVKRYQSGMLLQYAMHKAGVEAVQQLNIDSVEMVNRIIENAARAGAGSVPTPKNVSFITHQDLSALKIADDLNSKLADLRHRITRFPDDAFRAATSDAAKQQVLGNLTPAEAQQQAYAKLMSKGITGFTDSRGRNWTLSAYVEMAVRTSAQRAFNASHLDRLQRVGFHYFTVSDDGRPCPLCLPFQNRILSDGQDPEGIAFATIEEATAAGLFHPNCRHTLLGYTPGTELPEPQDNTPETEAAYNESQAQRALERDVRSAKRELEGAYTPEMKRAAQLKVRTAQKVLREFIDQTGATRVTRREQLNLGY